MALGGFHLVAGELFRGVFQDRLAAKACDTSMGFVVFREFLQQFSVRIEADAL